MATLAIVVNGRRHRVRATAETPLLYVLRNELELTGPRFGCGLAQCGACSVLLGGKEIRSCITPVAAVGKQRVTTLEGLAATWKGRKQTVGKVPLHPIQQAWIEEQVPQCGYCQNGMMVRAIELLNKEQRPSDAQIKSHMNTHLCRCGTYTRITKAIKRAGAIMERGA